MRNGGLSIGVLPLVLFVLMDGFWGLNAHDVFIEPTVKIVKSLKFEP
jgi:hypothetical protein